MSMHEDIFRSVRSYLYEKSSSPLAGSLVVSWLAWNWEFVMVIFSAELVREKFRIISHELYISSWDIWVVASFGPIGTAAIYLFLFPYPAYWAFAFTRWRQVKLNKKRQDLEEEELISKKDERAMRKEWDDREAGYLATIDRLSGEIARQNQLIDTLRDGMLEADREEDEDALRLNMKDSEGNDLGAPAETSLRLTKMPDMSLSDDEKSLLSAIALSKLGHSLGELEHNFPEISKTKLDYSIDKLKAHQFIKIRDRAGGGYVYMITENGRAYVVENHLTV